VTSEVGVFNNASKLCALALEGVVEGIGLVRELFEGVFFRKGNSIPNGLSGLFSADPFDVVEFATE